jgi:hypothetical protein
MLLEFKARQGTYAARRNTHIGARETIHQQISINAETQKFPLPQLLTTDVDHFGRNMS